MRLNTKLEWGMGFLIGILAPAFGIAVFFQLYPALQTVTDWFDPSWQLILLRLTTFGIGLNVLIFFLALRFNKEWIARGVLWATIAALVPVGIMQFVP